MSHRCPICGQDAPPAPLTIYRERGMVVCGGEFAILTATECDLLVKMAQVFPRVMTTEAAMSALYGHRPDDEPDPKIIDVFICKLRKKIAPIGIEIDTSWGRGYALRSSAKPVLVQDEAGHE